MKGKELLLIAISSFVLTVIWIASNVYHSYATSTIDTLLQIQILPIPPTFDTATISKLKDRQIIAPTTDQFVQTTPTPSIALSPIPDAEEVVPTLPAELDEVSLSPTPTPESQGQDETEITPTPIESGQTP